MAANASAYVLIDVVGDNVRQCLAELRKTPGVVTAHAVAGPYDIIAFVEGDSVGDIGQTVVGRIRQIAGVHESVTCFSMEIEG